MKYHLTILLCLSFNVFSCNKTPYNFTPEKVNAALIGSGINIILNNDNLVKLYGKHNKSEFVHNVLALFELKKTTEEVYRRRGYKRGYEDVREELEYKNILLVRAPFFLKELLKPSENCCYAWSSKNRFYHKVSKKITKKLELSYTLGLEEYKSYFTETDVGNGCTIITRCK